MNIKIIKQKYNLKKWFPKTFTLAILALSLLVLAACSSQPSLNNLEININSSNEADMMGDDNMMRFHTATVPEVYAGLTNPISSSEESIMRGQEVYVTNCAVCHGDGGMGDGPGGETLDPSPAQIAHTSQMMGDGYLYWRISEGGSEYETAMISFKDILSEQDRWDVINYVRALGNNEVMPQNQFGGITLDPEVQATEQAEMLATAVVQNVITQDEANLFANLHNTVDEFIENNRTELSKTDKTLMESGLEEMVAQGILAEEEANQFSKIHDQLIEADLMD